MGCQGEIPRHLVLDTRCLSLRSRLSSYFEFWISVSRLPQMFQTSIIVDYHGCAIRRKTSPTKVRERTRRPDNGVDKESGERRVRPLPKLSF